MPQKRFRAPKKAKPAAKAKIASSIGQTGCHVCKKPVVRDNFGVKPYGWQDHARDSDAHEKGFVLVLTCSDECRKVYYGGK